MELNNNKILVTGTAGFIGYHLVERLFETGADIVGLDVINDYYDINLKYDRLSSHGIDKRSLKSGVKVPSTKHSNYAFMQLDFTQHDDVVAFIIEEKFDYVVNLAAQAGVRHSITNPRDYTKNNIDGFLSILEGCRHAKVKHLIYASTSSVYGLNTEMPLSEKQPTSHPISLYAATKKANEMMAHSYSHLFNLPTTGLRFFTVYGPWGRPDMALFLFAKAMLNDEPINIFNHGNMIRDFTYVDDIVESILRLIPKPTKPNSNWNTDSPDIPTSSAPYQVLNIGNGSPVPLMKYIEAIEEALGKKGTYNMMGMQPGDVTATHADTSSLENYVKFKPDTSITVGVAKFIAWFRAYYNM